MSVVLLRVVALVVILPIALIPELVQGSDKFGVSAVPISPHEPITIADIRPGRNDQWGMRVTVEYAASAPNVYPAWFCLITSPNRIQPWQYAEIVWNDEACSEHDKRRHGHSNNKAWNVEPADDTYFVTALLLDEERRLLDAKYIGYWTSWGKAQEQRLLSTSREDLRKSGYEIVVAPAFMRHGIELGAQLARADHEIKNSNSTSEKNAEQILRQLIIEHPDLADAYVLYSILRTPDHFSEVDAAQDVRRMLLIGLEQLPEQPELLAELAYIDAEFSDAAQANQTIQRAESAGSTGLKFMLAKGVLLAKTNEDEAAIRTFAPILNMDLAYARRYANQNDRWLITRILRLYAQLLGAQQRYAEMKRIHAYDYKVFEEPCRLQGYALELESGTGDYQGVIELLEPHAGACRGKSDHHLAWAYLMRAAQHNNLDDAQSKADYQRAMVLESPKELIRQSLEFQHSFPAARVLVHHGFDLNTPVVKRLTSLTHAIARKREYTVEYVLELGADPNYVVEGRSTTPLSSAVRTGQDGVVRLLLSAGAEPNTAAPNGMTPLAEAVLANNAETARLLVSGGADVDAAVPAIGLSALELAKRLPENSVADVLKKPGV